MKKKGLLTALSIMAVGFAAVSTALYINGTSKINTNDDDFKVYYSDAKVNGIQDLSVVVDETHLSFNTTLDTLGDTYILDYDVTNGSKNYDADLEMTCTGGNEYLTVSNEFDDESILEALDTRNGKLTLTLSKSYTGADLDVNIDCNIKANAVERNSLGSGTAVSPVEAPYAIGKEINLAGELFNVISEKEDMITLLAQNGLDSNYKQSETQNNVSFSNSNGWKYSPGPIDIDIQQYDGNVKTYVNNYVLYLQTETGISSISGNLITLAQLKELGCTINDDYRRTSGLTCANSKHADWLITDQNWWTRSVVTSNSWNLWVVFSSIRSGELFIYDYSDGKIIRPVITISKSDLKSLGY